MCEIGRPLRRSDDERDRAVDLVAQVEHPERLVDPSAGEVVVERDGRTGDRVRIAHRVRALLNCDGAEVLRSRAVDVLVAAAPHREPLRGNEVPLRCGELALSSREHLVHRLAVTRLRSQDAEDDDHLGLTGDDRGRGPGDHRRHHVAAPHHAGAPAQVVDADRVRDLHR